MKIIGTGTFDANRTTMTNSLSAALLLRPEISTHISNLFEDNFTAFSSYLSRMGLNKKGLYAGLSEPNFKVIGNRKFMWSLKGYPFRKGVITDEYYSAVSMSNPGINGSEFTIYLDTDYFSPYDVLELSDRYTGGAGTQIQIMNEYPQEVSTNIFAYKCKLNTNYPGNPDAPSYVNPALLMRGQEVGYSHNAFPEMSETGYEKNTFPEWHTEYMTIQRMQYSISGSAGESVLWVEHNGQKLWFPQQDFEMMRRWAYSRENQLLFGQATIDANDHVYLKDLLGRDIIKGNGIMTQGTGALKYQYNTLSMKVVENVMRNMQLLANNDGPTELFVMGGQAFVWDFNALMRDVFKYNPMPLFVSDAQAKQGVKSNFTSYEGPGVRLVVAWSKAFDAVWRPQAYDMYGVAKDSRKGIFCSLGNTIGGDPMIELIALGKRAMIKNEISGMTAGKEFTSNSMDGKQVQILSETGIALRNPYGVAELYVP
jgi:hypothetical protein